MQGLATCLFLCMDACGMLYGSKELTDDCVFNEMLEQHYYNSYSSAKYSSTGPRGKSLYLALDRRGAPRRVQLKRDAPHGRLAAYTRVLTKPVPAERVADLLSRLRGAAAAGTSGAGPHFRHRGHHAACPPHGHPEATPRRPSLRRCPRPHAQPGPRKGHGAVVTRRRPAPMAPMAPTAAPKPAAAAPLAVPMHPGLLVAPPPQTPAAARPQGALPRRKCEATEDEDLCHKRLQMIAAKKRKSRNEKKHHQKRLKVAKKAVVTTTTLAPRTATSLVPFSSTTPTAALAVPTSTTTPRLSGPSTSPSTPRPKPDSGEMVPEAHAASTEASEEEDGEEDQEEHDDSVTMTTEAVATTVSLEDVLGTAAAPGLADGPFA
ncbi:E3 ubiquitin-protein ligase synoviolin isoform X2 [Thrips palmi]|nr:E3 ubiquitin-protein ligase synoviolin isoform X2 [Thrips palmi]XP_034253575.1 E3 ubiquitin-protein ligase synoviolin isoform X2 [Thrips palmi]